ncbi:MAG: hypothetical protein GY724_12530 [Actinomycetia bacterium]|nr:hypothetical protein [Actinomycetes bacterium]MCP5035632.1 hypothetical protein [Actinomycetes bacterium]
MTTKVIAIEITTSDPDRSRQVCRTVSGTDSEQRKGAVWLPVGDTWLILRPRSDSAGADGVTAIELEADDLAMRAAAIGRWEPDLSHDHERLEFEINGIRVGISQSGSTELPVDPGSPNGATLDHLALLVADLEQASERWRAITGVEAEQMGFHPLSDGAFSAARVHLGSAMIELVCPTPGHDTPMASRLISRGEGPAALALPVGDLGATLDRLRAMEVRVDHRPPHWMIHPRHASGVLVQLTPRVEH